MLAKRRRKKEEKLISVYACDIIVVGLAAALKAFYRTAEVKQLSVFLLPIAEIIEAFFSTPFLLEAEGYYYPELAVIITKDCSGVNFFIISCLLLFFSYNRIFPGLAARIGVCGIFIIFSYLLTLTANSSRIVISIFMHKSGYTRVITGNYSFLDRSHLLMGAFVFFFFLVGGNILAKTIFKEGGGE